MLTDKQQAHLAAMKEGAELVWVFEDDEDYDKGGAWFLHNEDKEDRPQPVSVEDAIAMQVSGYLEQLTVIGDAWGYRHGKE